MKNCRYCGTEITDEAVFCPNCGANQNIAEPKTEADRTFNRVAYTPSTSDYMGWCVLGFFFPLIALLCYFLWRDTEPAKALAIGKGGLISISFNPIIGLVVYLVMKDRYPDISKACGITAIIGLVFYAFFYIFYFALIILMMFV